MDLPQKCVHRLQRYRTNNVVVMWQYPGAGPVNSD
jgi:hypothetical protein